MSTPLILSCLWVFAGVITAMLPIRRQYIPGATLLLCAPLLLIYIGWVHGPLVAGAAALAVLSMMRNPIRFVIAKLRGQNPQLPE